jgi:hypothetical protein
MRFLIVIPYSITYTWEKRDIRPQSWDGSEHYRDRPNAKLPLPRTKMGHAKIQNWDKALYNIKEEVTHDD